MHTANAYITCIHHMHTSHVCIKRMHHMQTSPANTTVKNHMHYIKCVDHMKTSHAYIACLHQTHASHAYITCIHRSQRSHAYIKCVHRMHIHQMQTSHVYITRMHHMQQTIHGYIALLKRQGFDFVAQGRDRAKALLRVAFLAALSAIQCWLLRPLSLDFLTIIFFLCQSLLAVREGQLRLGQWQGRCHWQRLLLVIHGLVQFGILWQLFLYLFHVF